MKTTLLVLSLCTALAPLARAAEPQAAAVAAPRPDYFQFAHMHQMFLDRARVAPVGLLFLGDSITEAWWNVPEFWWERYGAHQPANFGISGDRTQNVIWRLEHGALDRITPRVIVLMIGTNNTGDNSAAEIVAGIDRILGLIRAKSPQTKVLLLGIFPRGPRHTWDGKPEDWEKRMAVIREVNTQLSARDDKPLVCFLDIGHVFLDAQGKIPGALMPDQLHLSNAAYKLWADAMQPLLDTMLRLQATGYDLRKLPTATATVEPPPAPLQPATPPPADSTIRIDAGSSTSFTDAAGNVWLSDRGFDGGDVVAREDDLKVENTKDAALYRTERWGMSSFSQPLPNGKYVVKLHFAETYEGITGPGERVFSFNVEGREFPGFDVWLKASGPRRAYVESVNVTVADGKLDITFASNVDNPAINGIEIIPAP